MGGGLWQGSYFPIKNDDFPWQNVSSPEGMLVISSDFRDPFGIHRSHRGRWISGPGCSPTPASAGCRSSLGAQKKISIQFYPYYPYHPSYDIRIYIYILIIYIVYSIILLYFIYIYSIISIICYRSFPTISGSFPNWKAMDFQPRPWPGLPHACRREVRAQVERNSMETHWTTPKNDGTSPFFMGKSTIPIAIFNSYVSHNQRVISNSKSHFVFFFSCVANFAASKLDGCRFQAPEKATRLVLSFHVMPGDASCWIDWPRLLRCFHQLPTPFQVAVEETTEVCGLVKLGRWIQEWTSWYFLGWPQNQRCPEPFCQPVARGLQPQLDLIPKTPTVSPLFAVWLGRSCTFSTTCPRRARCPACFFYCELSNFSPLRPICAEDGMMISYIMVDPTKIGIWCHNGRW